MHIRFKILTHSHQQVDEQHIDSVILYKNLFMSVLMSILHLHVFNYNNKVVHCHEVLSSSSH